MKWRRSLAKRVDLRRKRGVIVGAFSALGKAVVWIGPNRLLSAAVLGLLVALSWLGAGEVSRWAQTQGAYDVDVSRLSVGKLPPWCDEEMGRLALADIRSRLSDRSIAEGNLNITDPGLTLLLAERYASSPWVREVKSVRRSYPGRISVDFELRRPFCMVERGALVYALDQDAVRLPRLPGERSYLPVIKGVRTIPPPVGREWADEAVKGAIDTLLAVQSSAVRIAQVDVSNYGGHVDNTKSEIVLLTAANQTIEWGRAPNSDRYGEVPVEEKLRSLREALASAPEGAVIKVRFRGGGV